MAEIDPWDGHLEAVTTKLEAMTSGRLRGRVTLEQKGGWTVEFRGAGRSLTVQYSHAGGAAAMPGDYAKAVIYGCDYHPLGNEGRPIAIGKTLTLREGFKWDEESVREVVLEALGLLRYVLGVQSPDDVAFQDHTRQSAIAAARATVQRKKR